MAPEIEAPPVRGAAASESLQAGRPNASDSTAASPEQQRRRLLDRLDRVVDCLIEKMVDAPDDKLLRYARALTYFETARSAVESDIAAIERLRGYLPPSRIGRRT